MSRITFIFNFILLWQSTRSDGADLLVPAVIVVGVIFIFILFLIALAIISFFAYKRLQKRVRALKAFAADDGWEFLSYPPLDHFPDSGRHWLFRIGHTRQIPSLMQKPLDGGQMFVFDYTVTTGSGKNSKTYKMTVIAFMLPRLQLPYFSLYPESVLSFLGELVGWNDIDFESHPNFSRVYKLSTAQEMQVRQTFHSQVLTSFETMPKVSLDGGGNCIFVYTPKQTIEIESLNRYIDEAMKIFDLFRR